MPLPVLLQAQLAAALARRRLCSGVLLQLNSTSRGRYWYCDTAAEGSMDRHDIEESRKRLPTRC